MNVLHNAPPKSGDRNPFRAIEGFEREMSLRDLLRIFRRQLRFIVVVASLFLAPVALYAILLKPKYTAVASVVVEPRPQLLLLADGSPAAQPPDPAYIETLASVIRSRTFTARTMADLDLFADPEFLPAPLPVLDRFRGWVAQIVARTSPSSSPDDQAPVDPVPAEIQPSPADPSSAENGGEAQEEDWNETMAIFDDRLRVRPQSQSYVMQISFTSLFSDKAAVIANSLAQQFIEMQLAEKSAAVQRAIRGISGRLSIAQEAVLDAEKELEEIRLESSFVPGQPMPVSHMQAEETARALMRTQAAYSLANGKLSVVEELRASGGTLEDLPEVVVSPVVGQLRLQIRDINARVSEAAVAYGEDHPRTQAVQAELEAARRQMFEEIDRIAGSIRSEATIIAAQLRELEQQLKEARDRSVLDSAATARLQSAERDAEVKRSLYVALLRRQEEAAAQEGWLAPDVRLISEAAPPLEPSTHDPIALVAAGATVALVLASLLALMREQMDSSLRSNRQLETELGVPCLGLVPRAKRVSRGSAPLVIRAPTSSYAQSVGAIWVQLRLAAPQAKVIFVTSALPREGTSSLAMNLAYCALQSDDLRTAMIDFDLWSARGRSAAATDAHSGGTDFLRGPGHQPLSLDSVRKSSPETGIDVFSVGPRQRGATTMTGEKAGATLFDDLRERYDMVIVDGPPLLGVSDAGRLASFADASLLTIRWGSTSVDAASSALQILTQSSVHVVGAVLNDVHAGRQSLYGRGDSVQYRRMFRKYFST